MSWLKGLFSGGVSEVVDSVGNAIDKLVTSDEERDKLKIELEKEVNKFKHAQLQALEKYDEQISKRHQADMMSDSWLSKNVRPLLLVFLTATTVLLAYLTIFMPEKVEPETVEPWLNLLETLLITAYGFYFGSRGIEKVQSFNLSKKQNQQAVG